MIPALDIDCLRTFAAVAESGSFTLAGERVSRTQSAVSMQIKRLEQSLGRAVLLRNSRAISLTPEGEVLLDYARRILELNDESVRRIARRAMAGRLRIGVTEYFVPQHLPRILASFATAHPGVGLDVRMGLSGDLRAALAAGKLDAAIVRAQPQESASRLWIEPQMWVAASGWALPAGAALPLVALPSPCVLRAFAIDTLKRGGRPWRMAYTGSSMASVQAAVLAGLGVSIVSHASVLPGMQVLAGRSFPDPGPLEITLVRAASADSAIIDALRDVALDTLAGGGTVGRTPGASRGISPGQEWNRRAPRSRNASTTRRLAGDR